MYEDMDSPEEPEEGDYCIVDARGGGEAVAQYGKALGTFEDRDEAKRFILEHMSRHRFWPNVWWVSDHGNAHILGYEDFAE